MRLCQILSLVVAVSLAGPAVAAEPVTIGEVTTVKSTVLNEERTLMVYLPEGYEGSETQYPVVYLLDPRTRFHHTTGTLAALARIGHVPAMIVVGVVNTDRTRDLTPTWTHEFKEDSELARIRAPLVASGGGADPFLRFLREELAPAVERRYRVAPFRILVGHSFGGLFAVHAFTTEPDFFDAVLAISPSLWWDEGRLVEVAKALFEARPELSGRLYLTLADEGGDMLEEFQAMETLLRYRAPEGLSWEAHVLDGEDHGSIPVPSVYAAFRSFFPRWQVPAFVREEGLKAVDRHYAALTGEYGYDIETPEALINDLGYEALGAREVDKAIEILSTNVERFPASANVYDSLGEAMEAAGELHRALKLYDKACEIGEGSDDPNLAIYLQHRDAVLEKLDPVVGSGESPTAER